MNSERKISKDDGVRISNSILNLAFGDVDDPPRSSPDELTADLKEAGVDLDSAWKEARKKIDAAVGQQKLAQARRERLAAQESRTTETSTTSETRESLIAQIKRLLSAEPAAAVYARKWEEGNLGDLISLRDSLASTNARESARRNACG